MGVSSSSSTAQIIGDIDKYTDSLKYEKTDAGKVDRLNVISKYYYAFDIDKSLNYVNQAYLLADKINYTKGLARALDIKSIVFDEIGELNKALEFKYKSIEKYKKINDFDGLCSAYNNLGVIFFRQSEYKKAIEHYLESLSLADEHNLVLMQAVTRLNIGEVYLMEGELNKAMDLEEQSLAISQERNFEAEMGYAKGILGKIYIEKGYYVLASSQIKEAIKYFWNTNENTGIAEYSIEMARIHLRMNNPDSAISSLKQSIFISELLNAKIWKLKAYSQLANVYEMKKMFKQAYEYERISNLLSDSIYNEANALKSAQMKILFETENKESQIKLLIKEREKQELQLDIQKKLTYISIFAIVVISILAFTLFRNNKKRAKINRQLRQKNSEVVSQRNKLDELHTEKKQINDQLEKSYSELEVEKNKSEKLLLNILPETVANEIKRYGKAQPMYYNQVSILFADFVNFTKYASENDPNSITNALEDFFSHFDDICERHNLEKIKTIGDCYMAAGGLPIANDTNPSDTIKAALEILEYVKTQKWQVRIGIHTGPVVAGVIGKKKFAYDIWGDSVNIASRIQTASEVNQINISGATYSHIKDITDCEYRGKVIIKNRGEIEMYFLTSYKSVT
ncbi:MAG: adenylate/guanylate cyclase domain-containing protein [Cytophagales bacterium]